MDSRPVEFRESVLQIGSPVPLNGVLLTPGGLDVRRPCLVILNSGLLHHVGSCGFSVKLARKLAQTGHASCRFDFSGIGDSPTRPGAPKNYVERMESEVKEVVDHLQHSLGCHHFVLYGLCSGAFTALGYAAKDPRIVGVAQIAPQSFRTPRWYRNYYLSKLSSPIRIIKRILSLFRGQEDMDNVDTFQQFDLEVELPDKVGLTAQYNAVLARKGQLFALSTRGETETYNYVGQLRDMLPKVEFGNLLEEHFFPDTRHIISEPEDQATIVELLARWIAAIPPKTS